MSYATESVLGRFEALHGKAPAEGQDRGAEGARDGADEVRAGSSKSEYGVERSNYGVGDTRENLEADAEEFVRKTWSLGRANEVYRSDAIIPLLDRQAAITEREVARNAEHYYGAKVDEMQAELKNAERERDEFSAKLRHEMELNEQHRNAHDAERIAELQAELDELQAKLRAAEKSLDHWKRVAGDQARRKDDERKARERERRDMASKLADMRYSRDLWKARCNSSAPIIAKDGQPIEVGQVLYGESDGKGWRVIGFEHGTTHSVVATSEHSPTVGNVVTRDLKPGWLTHERPDTYEIIADEMRKVIEARAYDELPELAERIKKLAKEGER